MKKIICISILIALVLLSGCSVSETNTTKQSVAEPNSTQAVTTSSKSNSKRQKTNPVTSSGKQMSDKKQTPKSKSKKNKKSRKESREKVSYYGFVDPINKLKPTKKNAEKYDKLRKTTTLKDKTRAAYRHYKNGVEIIWQEDYGINLKPTEDNYISVPAYIKGKPVIKLGGEYGDEDPIWEGKDDFYKYYYFINCFSGSNATKIYLPATVKEIVKGTFDIDDLESIEVDKNNPYYSSKDGILYDKSGKIQLCVPRNHHSRNKD